MAKKDSKKSWLIKLKIRVDRKLGVLLITAGLALLLNQSAYDTPPTPTTTYRAVETALNLELEDSSSAILNKGGVLKVRFTGEARDIELPHGEALFRVSPDPVRPFRVVAGIHVSVRALGTVFLVSQTGPYRTEILVRQGRVTVSYGAGVTQELDAGSSLQIQHDIPSSLGLTAEEIDARLGWANPLAEAKDRDLAEIVRALNEFNDTQLVIEDRKIAHVPIGGNVILETQPEEFARYLQRRYKIQMRTDRRKNGQKVILLSPKEEPVQKHR